MDIQTRPLFLISVDAQTYASDENIKYSGFGEKIPNYEEQGMKSPQEWIYTQPRPIFVIPSVTGWNSKFVSGINLVYLESIFDFSSGNTMYESYSMTHTNR